MRRDEWSRAVTDRREVPSCPTLRRRRPTTEHASRLARRVSGALREARIGKRELGSASRTQQRLKRTRRKPGGGESVSPDRRRHHHQVVCAPSSFAHFAGHSGSRVNPRRAQMVCNRHEGVGARWSIAIRVSRSHERLAGRWRVERSALSAWALVVAMNWLSTSTKRLGSSSWGK